MFLISPGHGKFSPEPRSGPEEVTKVFEFHQFCFVYPIGSIFSGAGSKQFLQKDTHKCECLAFLPQVTCGCAKVFRVGSWFSWLKLLLRKGGIGEDVFVYPVVRSIFGREGPNIFGKKSQMCFVIPIQLLHFFLRARVQTVTTCVIIMLFLMVHS